MYAHRELWSKKRPWVGACACVQGSRVHFFFFFLQHDTYIHYIKIPFTGLPSHIALHYLLTVLLR